MKHIVRKVYFDFEKEEQYLNEMSAKGLALTDYSWCKYVFEEAPKGEYIYRIELLENPVNHPTSQDYIKFMEETGSEFVASFQRWVYFRRKANDGQFDIYSDIDSKLKHYQRVQKFFVVVTVINLLAGFYNLFWGKIATSLGHFPINTYLSVVSFALVAFILIFWVVPLSKKISFWEKEKEIRE